MNGTTRKELYGVLGITLAAALLRFHNLGEWSIFSDEVNTMVESRDFSLFSAPEHVNRWTLVTNALSHMLTGFAYKLFGESLFTARLFPALFGIASLPLFYFLIRKLMGVRVAFLTILFIAFSPNLIFLSGYARYNSMLFFFGGASFLYFLVGLAHRSMKCVGIGTILYMLAILIHATAVMVPGVILLFILLSIPKDREGRRHYIRSSIVLAAPFILMILLVRSEIFYMVDVIITDFRETGMGYPPHRLVASVAYNDGPVQSILALYAAYRILAGKGKTYLAVLLYWSVPLILITAAASHFTVGPRYLHSVLPGFYLLAAIGVDGWMDVLERKSRLAQAFLVIFIIASQGPLLLSNMSDGGRYDTNSAARFVMERCEVYPNAPVLADSHMIYNYLSEGELNAQELPPVLEDLVQTLKNVETAFLVYPLQRGVPLGFHGAEYGVWIKRNCRLLEVFTSSRYDFMRYEIAVHQYTGIKDR